MIIVDLEPLLNKNRMTLADLSKESGIPLENLSRLTGGKIVAIRFPSLNAICNTLECQPGDLLKYQADNSEQ